MQQENQVDYDTVAFALLNAFSKGDMEDEKDNSLAIFLAKLFKNNSMAKCKRMNSIRLSRFNAFLYRVNSPFPEDLTACQVIHASLLAMLSNDRNFEQEQDEEIIMSIAEWSCKVMENTVKKGFYNQAINSLKYLLDDNKLGQVVLPTAADFEQMVKQSDFLGKIQLTGEDEVKGFIEPSNYHLTDSFSLKQHILNKIDLYNFYHSLFSLSNNRAEVMNLFNHHLKMITDFDKSKTTLFVKVFLNDKTLIQQQLGLILRSIDEQAWGVDSIGTALVRIFDLGISLEELFKLEMKGTKTEELLLQLLKEKYNNNIGPIAECFLATQINNMIAPYLFVHCEQALSVSYIQLLFQPQLTQKKLILAIFALAHHFSDKLYANILQSWEEKANTLDSNRVSFVMKALYLTLCNSDKSRIYSKLGAVLNINTINGPPLLQTIPQGHARPEKLSPEHKNKLMKLLNESKVTQSCLPIKVELLGLCGQNLEMSKRIKYLQNLFTQPIDEILKVVSKNQINKDKTLLAAILMGLNNKMEVTFVEDPDQQALSQLAILYYNIDCAFGKKLGQLINQKENSPLSLYLWCLSRYNIHTKNQLGNFSPLINDLLSGKQNYNRVKDTDFSGYFYKEEAVNDLESQLWLDKKIMMESRKILRKLVRKDKGLLNDRIKDVQPLLTSDAEHLFAVKLVRAYFYADIDNPEILKQVLSRLAPTFIFLQKVFGIFQTHNEEFIDLLEFLPDLLKAVYPEALSFLAKIVDSQPNKKDKEKKKAKKKKSQDKNLSILGYQDLNPIFDLSGLYDHFRKTRQYSTIFGDPSSLDSYDELFRIITKLPREEVSNFNGHLQGWLQRVTIFHPQKGEQDKWRNRVLSYCNIWKQIFFDIGITIKIQILTKHFDILAQLLNIHYESKAESPHLQEQLLLTLLLIMQGGQSNMGPQKMHEPIEELKNCLLGYRLPSSHDQHFFTCNTCSISVCQVCAPFLHKHHDLNYTGKDGTCIHDSAPNTNNNKKVPPLPEPARANLFSAQIRQRRDEDMFAMNFDLGMEDQMQYNEHIRFRQLMEYRLQQQRQREMRERGERVDRRQHSRSRDRDPYIRLKEEIIEDKLLEQNSMEIISQTSKSICNLDKGYKSNFMFCPQFTPSDQVSHPYSSPIDARPLRHILMRQLQMNAQVEGQQGKSRVEVVKDRYNFFKNSAYFKTNKNDYGGLMRGLNAGNIAKRNLLTSNKKFLAFPSNTNGILLLSVTVMGMKLQRRQNNKAMADYEQERTYITNAINNSNLAFQPFQLVFGKHNLLAVIGVAQLGFFVLNNQGKVQRFMESDIKCAEMISKFQWVGRQRSNVFALSYGNNIRLGNVAEDLRIRTGSRLKMQIDKTIRDFEVQLDNHNIVCLILDTEGCIYRAQFDFRDVRTVNISDKKVQIEGMSNLQSMVVLNKKIIVSNTAGKLYLLKNEYRNGQVPLLQTYDIENLLKNSESRLKGQFTMTNPKVIHINENVSSIACILTRIGQSNDNKKKTGALAVLRISGLTNDLDLLLLSEDENIDHFEVLEIGDNSYSIVAVEESGTVWLSPYSVSSQLLQQREDSRLPLTDDSVMGVNRVVKLNKLMYLVRTCQPKKYYNYKDTKDITSAYNIAVEHQVKINLKANNPYKYFITGITINLEASEPGELNMKIWGEDRVYRVDRSREVQIGFSLKESLQCFVEDDDFVLPYQVSNCVFTNRNVKIHGVDFSQDSVYRSSYAQLHRIVTINYLYEQNNLVHYLENPEKINLPPTNLADLQKLKSNHHYSHKELVLLMKLELLRVSTSKGVKGEQIQQMLEFSRNNLLPQCERRQFLEKSCWKYIKQLSQLLLTNGSSVGHPFEFRTIIDFYYFERSYSLWNSSRTLSSFQRLVNILYSLIFKRISNLYLIMHLTPTLIYELTAFYKSALHSLKHSGEPQEQQQLSQLINLCPNFVALVCEYYQTLKNQNGTRMIDEQQQAFSEKSVLDLLQEVFCATKKQLYREIFVSPEQYLDRLYLSRRQPITLKSAVNIFQVPQQEDGDHASRKASACQQDPVESDEEQLQIQDQSEKQLMEEQQARQMPQSIQISSSSPPQIEQISSDMSNNIKKITQVLNNHLLKDNQKIHFVYYQFCFEMLTAIFKHNDIITKQNAVFYIGFAFNLIRIIEFNAKIERDRDYLHALFKQILLALNKSSHSILFLVLNYFFEPQYSPSQSKGTRTLLAPRGKLAQYLFEYLTSEKIDVEDLLLKINVTKTQQPITLTKAMKFVNFELENQIYQLRFIGNLFILLKCKDHPQLASPSAKIKEFVLSTVVKHNLRVFTNIMIWLKWTNDLEDAKIQVGFQTLKNNANEGIKLLYDCATQYRQVFVSKLAQNNDFISQLENLLGQRGIKQNSILEMLNIYYESI